MDRLRFFKKIKEIPFAEFIKNDWDLENKDCGIEVGAIENAFNEIKKYFKINPKSERVSQECIDKIISFNERLQKVRILRVEVPEGTNLNRYYERMNTRSEQLEQSDILKSKLMGQIEAKEGREFFSKIWNACADMNHYVQMGFDPGLRADIFGNTGNRRWKLLSNGCRQEHHRDNQAHDKQRHHQKCSRCRSVAHIGFKPCKQWPTDHGNNSGNGDGC